MWYGKKYAITIFWKSHDISITIYRQTICCRLVLLPHWAGGQDAALDVTIVHFFQDATLAQAATEPGYALTFAHQRKARGAEGDCRRQGIAFLPLVAESMGGWRASAEREIKKLGSALARHTGQLEGEAISHLWRRLGILLQRDNEGRGTPGKLGAYLPRTTHRWHNWIECISSRFPIANVISFALSLPPWVCHPEIYIQKTYWTYLLNLPNFPGLPDWTGLDNVCIMSV